MNRNRKWNEKAAEMKKNKNKKKKRTSGEFERNETEDTYSKDKGTRNGTKIALDIPLSCLLLARLGWAESRNKGRPRRRRRVAFIRRVPCSPPEAFQLQNPAKSPGDSRQLLAHPLYLLCLPTLFHPISLSLSLFAHPLSPLPFHRWCAQLDEAWCSLTKTKAGQRERKGEWKKKDTKVHCLNNGRVNTGVRQNRTGKARESQTDTSIFMSRFPFHVSNPPPADD